MIETRPVPPNHLILPSPPTPNGPLHLGHIAGPYLRADILRRSLLRRGAQVCTILAIDAYESYVLLRAFQNGRSPEQIVRMYKTQIEQDLEALRIDVDLICDPTDSVFKTRFEDRVIGIIEALRNLGVVEAQTEVMLYSPDAAKFVVGCWLQGRCPNCGREAGSYGCERCGVHYRPEMIIGAESRVKVGQLRPTMVSNLFLRVREPDKLFEQLSTMGVPPEFVGIVENSIKQFGSALRITTPGSWGVRIPGTEEFSQIAYSGFTSLATLFTCGDAYADLNNVRNPFRAGSTVVTVCSFGIDNLVTRALACVGAAIQNPDWRPPSSFLVSYFYLLEGVKFSTSRGHAIWAAEVPKWEGDGVDLTRLYLLESGPNISETNFSFEVFKDSSHRFVKSWNEAVEHCIASMKPHSQSDVPSQSFGERLRSALDRQDHALRLKAFRASVSAQVIRDWLSIHNQISPEDIYWWLRGLALIAWPVLPTVSERLWTATGSQECAVTEMNLVAAGELGDLGACRLQAM